MARLSLTSMLKLLSAALQQTCRYRQGCFNVDMPYAVLQVSACSSFKLQCSSALFLQLGAGKQQQKAVVLIMLCLLAVLELAYLQSSCTAAMSAD